MPRFTTISTNDSSPDRTFAFVIQLENWPLFRGYGPLPGIVRATLPEGAWGPGARIRVENSDGSVHHEVVRIFEPGRRYAIEMELSPPASHLMAGIDEELLLEPADGGTRVVRHFHTRPRGWWTAPIVWLVTHLLLKPAVRHHDAAVRERLRKV